MRTTPVITLFGFGFAFAFASACTKSGGTGPKVALLLATLQEERYQKDKRYFEEAARRAGLQPFTLAADNDNARQLAQLEDALERGAKVLVVQPTDSAAAAAYVGKAHEKGAKLVAYDRQVAGTPDFAVSHDSHKVGLLQAEAAVKATGGRGNYIILNGQSGHSVAREIARGYMDVLKPYLDSGAITVVVEKSHDAWSPEQALRTVEDAFAKTQGNVQAILANNSGMARGAVQAAEAAGKTLFIAGADADAANVQYVCQGRQSVEVIKEIKPLAEKAAEVAAALIRGEALLGQTAAVPVELVTLQNATLRVVASGFLAATAVPACK